ncbi:transposase [Gammaproteobacteria bacterium]
MNTFDARTLGHDTLEYIRIQAVKAVQEGRRIRETAKIFGIHRGTLHRWLKMARKCGMDALKKNPVPGRKSFLDKTQENTLQFYISVFTSINFGFHSTLWTTEIIQLLIEQKFSIHLSRSAINRLLHRIGLTPQRPARRSTKQNSAAVDLWLKEEFHKINLLAEKEGATIYFLDESRIRTDYHAGTTWSLEGLTLVIPNSGDRHSVNMIAAINADGKIYFQVGPNTFNGEAFIEYLENFSKTVHNPIWIITDRCSVHRSKMVMEYIEKTNGKVKIYFLPAYSPELNPVELVWGNIKAHGFARSLIHGARELVEKATNLLESLKQMPGKIRAFFKKESVQYAM